MRSSYACYMSRICFVSSPQGSFTCIKKEIFPFACDFVRMLLFYLTRLVGLEMWHAESFSFWVTSLGLVLTCFGLGPLPPKRNIGVGFWLFFFFFFTIVLASGWVFPFLHTHATITCFCNLRLSDTYLHCKCPVLFLHTHATIACFCILQLSDTSLHCKCPVCYY